MREHYGFTQDQFDALIKSGVTVKDLFAAVETFDPIGKGLELSKINLMYCIDSIGDFRVPPFTKCKKIAQAFYNKMSAKEKMEILEYIEWEDEDD